MITHNEVVGPETSIEIAIEIEIGIDFLRFPAVSVFPEIDRERIGTRHIFPSLPFIALIDPDSDFDFDHSSCSMVEELRCVLATDNNLYTWPPGSPPTYPRS